MIWHSQERFFFVLRDLSDVLTSVRVRTQIFDLRQKMLDSCIFMGKVLQFQKIVVPLHQKK